MITAYGIPNCNTVKKAVTWLKDQDLPYTFHDFKKQGVTAAQLNGWCAVFGWEKVLNKKGTTWRKLSADEQFAVKDQASAVAVMLANPSSIKRPVIERDGKALLIGFQEEEYAGILR